MRQFMKPSELAEELGCSQSHITKLVEGMRKFPERYPKNTFFGEGKTLAVRFVAVQDFSLHRVALENKRTVPPYDPQAAERDLGIASAFAPAQMFDADAFAKSLAASLGNALLAAAGR